MSIFQGNATAIVTPFNENGINYAALEKQIEFQIKNSTAALVVAGTTGEPPTMDDKEKAELFKFVIKQTNNRIPVIVGTGCNNTKVTIEHSKAAQDLGADGILLVTPYYNKTTQDGLVAHYSAILDSISIPAISYNVPSRTGLTMTAKTLQRIAKHENLAAHKDACGSLRLIIDMVRFCSDDIDILSGDDHLNFPILACGGKGVVSVISNIVPKECADMTSKFFVGDIEGAKQLQFDLTDLNDLMFCQVSPIPIKYAMNLMGMNAGIVRLPLVDLRGEDAIAVEALLRSMKLI